MASIKQSQPILLRCNRSLPIYLLKRMPPLWIILSHQKYLEQLILQFNIGSNRKCLVCTYWISSIHHTTPVEMTIIYVKRRQMDSEILYIWKNVMILETLQITQILVGWWKVVIIYYLPLQLCRYILPQ